MSRLVKKKQNETDILKMSTQLNSNCPSVCPLVPCLCPNYLNMNLRTSKSFLVVANTYLESFKVKEKKIKLFTFYVESEFCY